MLLISSVSVLELVSQMECIQVFIWSSGKLSKVLLPALMATTFVLENMMRGPRLLDSCSTAYSTNP